MTASGGMVKAQLFLDVSNFSKSWKTVIKSIETPIKAPVGITNLQKSMADTEKKALNLSKTIQTTFSHLLKTPVIIRPDQTREFEKLTGITYRSAAGFKNLITQMDAAGKKALDLNKRIAQLEKAKVPNFAALSKSLRDAAAASGGLEKVSSIMKHIQTSTSGANTELSKQKRLINEAQSSFAGTGRTFLPAQVTQWNRITGAANKAGNAIKGVGSRLSEAAASMSNFSAGLMGIMGTFGTQQFYNMTIGTANTYEGYRKYWQTTYGTETANMFDQTVKNMADKYYVPYSASAGAIQKIGGQSKLKPEQISQLTPYVMAYMNYYKAMKPEQAALAEIEAPQDIAAVFSGNVGEIRASPLAPYLKDIAKLPEEQRMPALQKLFKDKNIMEYVSGITKYDKEMNKLNTEFDKLKITVGNELLPTITGLLSWANDFIKNNPGLSKALLYAGGIVAALAAIGGIGGLVIDALSGVYKGLSIIGGGAKGLLGKIPGMPDWLTGKKDIKAVTVNVKGGTVNVDGDDGGKGGTVVGGKGGKTTPTKTGNTITPLTLSQKLGVGVLGAAVIGGSIYAGGKAHEAGDPVIYYNKQPKKPTTKEIGGGIGSYDTNSPFFKWWNSWSLADLIPGGLISPVSASGGYYSVSDPNDPRNFIPGQGSPKKSIKEDIFGKGGLLDMSTLGLKFPKISISNIGEWFTSKLPDIDFPDISLNSVKEWVSSKLDWLHFPEISFSSIGGWISSKIGSLHFPSISAGTIYGWIKGRITGTLNFSAIQSRVGSAAAAAVARVTKGPAGPSSLLYASGNTNFTYQGYGGIGQSIDTTLNSMTGNCVDGTLAQGYLANFFGIPFRMVETTWQGNPHVYGQANFGGGWVDRDIANKALTNNWSRPPAGPNNNNPPQSTRKPKEVHIYLHEEEKVRKIAIDVMNENTPTWESF